MQQGNILGDFFCKRIWSPWIVADFVGASHAVSRVQVVAGQPQQPSGSRHTSTVTAKTCAQHFNHQKLIVSHRRHTITVKFNLHTSTATVKLQPSHFNRHTSTVTPPVITIGVTQ
jgi:hypothetical protein